MVNMLQRFRPTRTTLAALVGLVWALSFGAVRDFVWADLREGVMSTRGLPRTVRALVWVGFALLAAMIGALLFNDLWRAQSPLIALEGVSSSTVGRGALLPIALLPATLFLVVLSWSFILAGVLHSHPLLRLVALAFYMPFALQWIGAGASSLAGSMIYVAAALACACAVPLLFALRWRAAPRPGLEFMLLFSCVTIACAIGQARAVTLWRTTSTPLALATMELSIAHLQSLVMPMLFLVGLDIAGFTRQAASWTVQIVSARLPRWAIWALLLPGLALRLYDVAQEAMSGPARPEDAGRYIGAIVGLLAVAAIWYVFTRITPRDTPGSPTTLVEAAERWALPLILAFHFLILITPLPALVMLAMSAVGGQSQIMMAVGRLASSFSPAALIDSWQFGLYLVALGVGVWLALRGRLAPALYLVAFGIYNLWLKLAEPGAPLAFLAQRGNEPEDFWLVTVLTLALAVLALRQRLAPAWGARLLFLLIITGLLRQTDFIENPFSPLLGFAGIGFVAFGLVWDALTRGTWANADSRHLPRSGRVLLYVGYVLLTATLVNWTLTSHNLQSAGQFTGDAAVNGLDRFGRPLLYLIFLMTLAGHDTDTAESQAHVR